MLHYGFAYICSERRHRPRRARLYVTLALLTFFLTPWANSVAAEPSSVVEPYPTGDFSLRFARHRADFDYPTRDIDTTVEWISVRWQEKLNSRVHGRLFGGWTTLTQDNNPATAGARLRGFHAGFGVHVNLLGRRRARLFLSADYTLQDVDDDAVAQKVSLEWHQVQLQIGVSTLVGIAIRLYGGLNHGVIDGRQRESGTTNLTIDFDRGPVSGGFAGLEGTIKENDFIGIELQSGLSRQAEVFFKHSF